MSTHGFRVVLLTVVAAIAAVICSSAWSHDPGEETVTPLQRQTLADVFEKQVIAAVVAYGPGQASSPHRHAGSVFAQVLEGEVTSPPQLEGQPLIAYKDGQTCYESPRVPHLVSRNASTTKPAKLLAWLLMDEVGQVKEHLSK